MPDSVGYIILRNSIEQAAHVLDPGTFHGHKFKIVFNDEYAIDYDKNSTPEKTLGGAIDLSIGHVFMEFRGVVRTAHTLTDIEIADGYGTVSDLKTYFLLNNPVPTVGNPSNLITLVDHYQEEHSGFLVGKFPLRPLVTFLTGEYAHYMIPIRFVRKLPVS